MPRDGPRGVSAPEAEGAPDWAAAGGLRLEDMLNDFPAVWVEQRDLLRSALPGG